MRLVICSVLFFFLLSCQSREKDYAILEGSREWSAGILDHFNLMGETNIHGNTVRVSGSLPNGGFYICKLYSIDGESYFMYKKLRRDKVNAPWSSRVVVSRQLKKVDVGVYTAITNKLGALNFDKLPRYGGRSNTEVCVFVEQKDASGRYHAVYYAPFDNQEIYQIVRQVTGLTNEDFFSNF